MKVEVKEISQVVKELTLTVEAEKVNKEYQKALKKVSKMAPPIPGFRKGKAPLSAIERTYGEYVKEELYKDGVNKYLQEAIEEHDIKSISEFYPISYDWELGDDLVAVFNFEVNPEIKLENIDGIKVPFKAIAIDEAVDKYISQMQKKSSQMVEVADEVQHEDTVEFEITFTHQGEEIVEVVTIPINLDSVESDPIHFDAIEKKIGDKFETQVAYFRIKTVTLEDKVDVKVTAIINSIQRLLEPEIDDDFAKELDYNDLNDMKNSLAQELALKNEHLNQQELNKKIMNAIIAHNDFQVPNVVIANEAYRQAKIFMPGKEPDEHLIKIVAPIVTPQLKEIYVYEALRKMYDDIEVTDEQVDALVEKLAKLEELSVEEFKEEHNDIFKDDRMKDEVLFDQIFVDLAKKVEIVDPEIYAAEKRADLKEKKEVQDKNKEEAKKTEE
ncbi:hypothetical protein JEZ13_02890 [bacterium]|nr:hypothetical protein [bacterium]